MIQSMNIQIQDILFKVSVEYSNDYQGAAAEVLALNQEITNQGYEMINAYWESVESLSSVNSYFDKYKTEVGPFCKTRVATRV